MAYVEIMVNHLFELYISFYNCSILQKNHIQCTKYKGPPAKDENILIKCILPLTTREKFAVLDNDHVLFYKEYNSKFWFTCALRKYILVNEFQTFLIQLFQFWLTDKQELQYHLQIRKLVVYYRVL